MYKCWKYVRDTLILNNYLGIDIRGLPISMAQKFTVVRDQSRKTHHRIRIAKMLRTPRFRQLVIKNKKRYNRKRYKNESES